MKAETGIREYETWDSNVPLLPSVSRLYHLAPIGMGTPMVESLTGYIVRLAEAHCVSAGVLYWKEIKAFANKGNIFTFRVPTDAGYSTHTINGFGSPAADFVRALEALTGRHDLSCLTMLTWAHVLPHHSLLRRCRAWCESCLHAWREADHPIYEPLLWMLQAVTVCPYHRRLLRQACPHCGHQVGPLESRSRCDHCSLCGQTLVPTTTSNSADYLMLESDELTWALWVANALGELLAITTQIICPVEREPFAQMIRLCIDSTCSRNASTLARLMQVGRGAVSRWQRGKSMPQLPTLLSLAYRLGISLPELLLGCPNLTSSPEFVRAELIELNQRAKQPMRQYGRRIHRVEVFRTLRSALNEIPPPSVNRVLGRLCYSPPTVYRHFPKLCRQIAQRYAEYRVKRATARKAQAAEEVKQVALELHAKGIRLSRQHIRPLLTSSDYLNLEEGRASLREVRRQLAQQISNG
jgi:transcriptional regulator with XRE-family HTH domain